MVKEKIFITPHAKNRFIQRTNINEKKMNKVVLKAYRSQDSLPTNYINYKEYKGKTGIYRSFLGYVFIFDKSISHQNTVILVTVYKV